MTNKTFNLPPEQYQKGWSEFFKLKFKLTPDVLIPRPETELLVEYVLELDSRFRGNDSEEGKGKDFTVLEIGTGSGCISVSIAKNSKDVKIIATDVSPKALEIAKLNAKFHRVEKRIVFLESDLISFIGERAKAPDVIATNLPYIHTARLMLLDPMVRDFEPKLALDGGRDGFEIYRRLFSQMVEKNFYPRFFIGEIDDEQFEIAIAEAKKYFPKAKSYIKLDLAKLNRFLIIEFS